MQKNKNIQKNILEPGSLNLKASAGFTLIEMIVSVALFSFVMLATTSVLLSVIDADHKAQGMKTTINNLSLTLESIARNLRTGSGYVVVNSGAGVCPSSTAQTSIGSAVSYLDQYGGNVIYQLNGGAIQVKKGGADPSAMTAPEIKVDRFCFYVSGTTAGDNIQPTVLITLGGTVSPDSAAGARKRTVSRFDLETFVTQRLPDVTRS